MSEHSGFDLEGEASRAWKSFATRLADHVAAMRDGDAFDIRLAGLVESESPQVAFLATGNDEVRSSIEAPDLSTYVEDGQPRLDEGPQTAIVDLGWQLDTVPQASRSRGRPTRASRLTARREADELSSLTVRLLVDVFGALHPVFLRVSGQADLVDYSAAGADTSVDDVQQPSVTEPVDSDHLRRLVADTIALELGREPARDVDGDLLIEIGNARVFVRVLEPTPLIHIFGRLVHNVEHPLEAPSVIAKLNAEYSFITFLFADDSVLASVHLPATPFVPVHLRRMLATFVEIADQLGAELVDRLGGERELPGESAGEPAAADDVDAIPPELVTLLDLDPDGVGLDAELTAGVCGHDRALAWQLLHIASGQEDVWRAAGLETDDPEEEAKCAQEAAGWKATRLSLASALELINTRPV